MCVYMCVRVYMTMMTMHEDTMKNKTTKLGQSYNRSRSIIFSEKIFYLL